MTVRKCGESQARKIRRIDRTSLDTGGQSIQYEKDRAMSDRPKKGKKKPS